MRINGIRISKTIGIVMALALVSLSCEARTANEAKSTPVQTTTVQQRPTTATLPRCQATTQKGTQCKRKAKDGSIYCWQHIKKKK